MDNENLAGAIIMLLCCWGCAAIFLSLGIWAKRRTIPMHFGAGSVVDPDSVSDITAYNRENGAMWKWYSVPYWIAGGCSLCGMGSDWSSIVSLIVLLLAAFPGLPLLIAHYNHIARKYISTAKKTK